MQNLQKLHSFLTQLHTDFHRKNYLSSDPLEFVHDYTDPWDQETVALLAALLAYGNVKQIRKSVQNALSRMAGISKSPSQFVRTLHLSSNRKRAAQAFEGFVHRFNQGSDLVLLFELLNQSWSRYGSLGGHFLRLLKPNDPDIGSALSSLIAEWRLWLPNKNEPGSFSYLLTSPADGSCCKRWCMFLRWMGRQDHLDLGLWSSRTSGLVSTFPKGHLLKTHQLVMPLDTHTGRMSQALSLTSRKSLNWKAALEVTQSLKKLDPQDPIRYDFALARIGILDIRPMPQKARTTSSKPRSRADLAFDSMLGMAVKR